MSKALAVILGAGPVGLAVGKVFLERGIPVRYVTRSGKAGLPGTEARSGDAKDPASLLAAAEGATILVHAVGVPYPLWQTEFPPMQAAVLATAEATGAVAVFAENLYSYSAETMPLRESTPEVPPTRKGAIRLQLSQQWLQAAKTGRVKAVSIRASDYFGPGATNSENSHFGSRFFPGFVAGKPVAFLGNPDARHSYTYLPDYARAVADVALDPTSWGRPWICPSLGPTTAREVAGLFAQEAEKTVKVGKLPRFLVQALGLVNPTIREVTEMLYQFERDFTVDASAFEAHFSWRATPLASAVRDTWRAHISP